MRTMTSRNDNMMYKLSVLSNLSKSLKWKGEAKQLNYCEQFWNCWLRQDL